jgi:response regulator RpfG family c-di-GMP phosphodiesterase
MTDNAPDRPVRVLVVGSDRRIRSGLAGLLMLDPSIELSGVAVDVAGPLDCCRSTSPDVVLVDPHLPDVPDGVALVGAVRRMIPTARIISVCVADDDDPDEEFDVRLHSSDDPGRIVSLVARGDGPVDRPTPASRRKADARLGSRPTRVAPEG